MKSNKLRNYCLIPGFLMLISVFLPWYGADGMELYGIATYLGMGIGVFCLLSILFLFIKRKVSFFTGILCFLLGLISLVINFFPGMEPALDPSFIGKDIPGKWIDVVTFGIYVYIFFSLVFLIMTGLLFKRKYN